MDGFSWDVGEALLKIKKHQEEAYKIFNTIENKKFNITDPSVKMECSKYIRWREATYNTIKKYVSNEEAEKFNKLKNESPYSQSNPFDFSAMHQDWNQLVLFIYNLSKALADEEIEINSEEVINRRYNILHKLYELTERTKKSEIPITDLATALNMDELIVGSTLLHWGYKKGVVRVRERKNGAFVELTHSGESEIEKTIKRPEQPTKNFHPNIVYNISGGNVQIGDYNKQQINTNDHLHKAIEEIKSLVKSSSLSEVEKEEVIGDVERFKTLSEKEKTKEVIEKAKGRLEIIEKGLKIGKDAGSLIIKAAPYLNTLKNLIHQL